VTTLSPSSTADFNTLLSRLSDADTRIDTPCSAVAPENPAQFSLIAKETDCPLMPVGSGSTTDYSRSAGLVIALSSCRLNSIQLYPEHQTVEVGAGAAVAAVNSQLHAAGLAVPALERFSSGTIGGRMADTPSTPLPGRDDGWIQSLLSITVMLANGDILTGGSHCIKDVAGYDLRHLFTGSSGALGIILSAVFRCRPSGSITRYPDVHVPSAPLDPRFKRLLDPTGRLRPGKSVM